jgi:hypothetical protein
MKNYGDIYFGHNPTRDETFLNNIKTLFFHIVSVGRYIETKAYLQNHKGQDPVFVLRKNNNANHSWQVG